MIEKTQSLHSLQFDPLYWEDPYPIALALKHLYPTTDPTEISLETLQHWVIALKEFADDKEAMPIERLEEIQVEWIEICN
jgi:FeS assembly protein IscX